MQTVILPTLYEKNKEGGLQQWTIRVEGNSIIKEYGKVGGKLQSSAPVAVIGKNIGKANETTPEEQAVKEAQAQWQKKLDKKYSETREEALGTTKVLPQHANEFGKHKSKVIYPCFVQRKYNGLNTMVREMPGIKLQSRGNKEYSSVQHINNAFAGKVPKNILPLGEIYLHGLTLEETNRRVKKYRGPRSDAMEFHVFDCVVVDQPNMPQDERLALIHELLREVTAPCIKEVETFIANNEAEVLAYEKQFVEEGFEGAMVRNMKAVYVMGKETYDVLKVKSFQDAEFKIVGYKSGKGKNLGCVTWLCELPDGSASFDVEPKGTYEDKAYWFRHADEHIGRMLMVKFYDYSEKGIPSIAVGVPGEGFAIRLYEDMDEVA
jgi:DNA ligase-1